MPPHGNDLSNLAELFLSNPRIAAAKRFDAICLRIILGLQSELREIERRGFQDIRPSSLDTSTVPQSSTGPTSHVGGTGEQLATFDDVRKKVETYQDFLLRYIKLYSLNHIDHIDHRALRDHLGDFHEKYPGSEIDLETWTDDTDLVSVLTNHLPKRDRFTGWLIDFIYWLMNGPLSDKFFKDEGTYYLNEDKIAKSMIVVNIFMASILNTSALFVLYVIDSTLARIGTICAFSLLFTLSSLVFTAADPIMVYTSTAAYSAVLVVFISNVN